MPLGIIFQELKIFNGKLAVEGTVLREASCGAVNPVVKATSVAMATSGRDIGTKDIYQYSRCRE